MSRPLFAADLDNTLIHSHRHHRPGDVCVEWIEGREQGYMSPRAVALLRRLNAYVDFVPVTSRSRAQYERLRFPEGCAPACAVTANGAALLTGSGPDGDWARDTEAIVTPCREALDRAYREAQACPEALRVRVVDEAFLFILCPAPEDAGRFAGALEPPAPLRLIQTGRKLYLLPPGLDKGAALTRLRARYPGAPVLAAGDSEMDVDMLLRADIALQPRGLMGALRGAGEAHECPPGMDLTEFVLKTSLRLVGGCHDRDQI